MGQSPEAMMKVLCPGAIKAGLRDRSITSDNEGVPIAWTCKGKCHNDETREEKCKPEPKWECPQIGEQEKQQIASDLSKAKNNKDKEKIIKKLCPGIAQLGLIHWSITLDSEGLPVAWECQGSDGKKLLRCGKNTCRPGQCTSVSGITKYTKPEVLKALCPGATNNGLNGLSLVFNKKGAIYWKCKGDC